MRDTESILEEAGRDWRAAQPPPARLDPVLFASSVSRRRSGLDLSFLAGAASATAVLVLVAVVAYANGLLPGGGGGPVPPTDPPSDYLPSIIDSCPVTRPEPDFSPPAGIPASPGHAWYGTARLYTMLDQGGEYWFDLPHGDRGYTQKTFWWRDGYRVDPEPRPEIYVTGKRLDGPGSFGFGPGTNAGTEHGAAMLVGVEVPSLGCWELTARYGRDSLSISVWLGE